jgi:2-polyprenyl-3-methyl-5-hydroxy-6-metoxy-1,4-benzoquinol methylase
VSTISATLFRWVQGAAFYTDVHREAVGLALREVSGIQAPMWLDVGCGPGLVARLAAAEGARATGIDLDPAMVRAACRHPGRATFEQRDARDVPAESADVVSAASLLYGATDPTSTVTALWAAVRPGGALLIIESTAAMTVVNARELAPALPSHRRHVLSMWARARNGATFDRASLEVLPSTHLSTTPLLHGLVEAIIAAKPR